jgi:hypothetical protein
VSQRSQNRPRTDMEPGRPRAPSPVQTGSGRQRQKAVRTLLTSARDRLDVLATRLLKEETMTDVELPGILGPRPARETAAPKPKRVTQADVA